jgi:hypothetical protein
MAQGACTPAEYWRMGEEKAAAMQSRADWLAKRLPCLAVSEGEGGCASAFPDWVAVLKEALEDITLLLREGDARS